MKVGDLKQTLADLPDDMEVWILYEGEEGEDTWPVDDAYVEERQFGVCLNPMPPRTRVLVIS